MKAKIKLLILSTVVIMLLVTNCTYDSIPGPENCSNTPVINVAEIKASECGKAEGGFSIESSETEFLEFSIDGSNFQTSNAFTGLESGIYQVTARTLSGCTSSLEVEIPNLSGFNVSINETPSSCNGKDGSIEVITNGGTAPFEYRINESEFQTDNNFSNLPSGEYSITTRDASGCEFTQTVTLTASVEFSEIKSIINNNCAISGCHNGSVSPNFTNENTINDRASRIRARTGNKTMPPSSSGNNLSDSEIEKIRCWSEGNT